VTVVSSTQRYNEKLGGRPAIADVNGDGRPDLLVAAGNGGGPRITFWPRDAFLNADGGQPTANPLANLFVFEFTQRGGTSITSGDVNGDHKAEIIVGDGPSRTIRRNGFWRLQVCDLCELMRSGGAKPTGTAWAASKPSTRSRS